MANKIASLLNSFPDGDIDDNSEFQDLFNDYFFGNAMPKEGKSPSEESDDSEEFDDDPSTVTDSVPVTRPIPNVSTSTSDTDSDSDTEGDILFPDHQTEILEAIRIDYVEENMSAERRKIELFSCDCTHYEGRPCCVQFGAEEIEKKRMSMCELADRDLKDMVLLGIIQSHICVSENTQRSKKKNAARLRPRTSYYVEGRKICRKTFRFMFAVGQDHLSKLIKHYQTHGLVPRARNYPGRRNTRHALTFETVTAVVSYISNYAEEHALILPGRIPGYHRKNILDVRLLPSSETKTSIWRKYVVATELEGQTPVQISSFQSLWKQLLPHVVVARPMTDLCWTCQNNNNLIMRTGNLPEEDKCEKLREQELHLLRATSQRSHLKQLICDSKVAAGEMKLGLHPPLSSDMNMHYSFDFAQQIHYPADPQQAGPIYFLTPRKCGLFGICCEAIPQQVNYLLDEAFTIKKGSDCVISFLHHFFSNYGLGETRVDLHCDNCSGQNKNKFVLWYLMWRTMTGHHQSITLNFLLTGHTKFSPDWCFGLVKKVYRRTKVSCLNDISEVVKASSIKGINIPQIVESEDGTIAVNQYDWQSFLSPFFKQLKNIKKYHHFRFDASTPGIIFYREYADSPEDSFAMKKNDPDMNTPPPVLPPGLDIPRQKYLWEKIRPFCRPDVSDLVCPKPREKRPVEDPAEDA